MHTIGFVGLFAIAAAVVTALSVTLYSALPKAALEYAERHGRFQGLADQETLRRGTRVGEPPARPLILGQQSA
jgi:hypothetical protein